MSMKARLFLLLTATLLAGTGAAHAQSLPCEVAPLFFPAPTPPSTPPDQVVKWAVRSGTCIAAPGQAARLRWDNNGSQELQLFDTDDGGTLLWCAHFHDTGTGACAQGASFCLQSDGNAVIYANDNCTGTIAGKVPWASNTVGDNVNGERMEVLDNLPGFPGERAVIVNGNGRMIVISNNIDPT